MEFIGCKSFEADRDFITIQVGSKEFDLHNAAEFEGYSYSIETGILKLNWKFYDNYKENDFQNISLIFQQISSHSISERDNGMPNVEDLCIEKIRFIPREGNIILIFRGGVEISVICSIVQFETSIVE